MYHTLLNTIRRFDSTETCENGDKKKKCGGGAWVAQSVGSLTLDFGLGHDLGVVGWSPTLGSVISGVSAFLTLSLSLCPSPCSCSLSK